MPNAHPFHRIRPAVTALVLAVGLSASAHAEQITFEFKGFVTELSNSEAFGGVALNEEITGTLSYDAATAPSQTWGGWAATYALQGSGTALTFTLANGRQYEDRTLNVRVVNGPVYPSASDDTLTINENNSSPTTYAQTGETSSLNLSFMDTTGVNGLSSANLPTRIDLSALPFSGGHLTLISGSEPTGDDGYIIDRRSMAYQGGPYYSGYPADPGVFRFSRSNPGQVSYAFSIGSVPYPGSERERYNQWLAAGNTAMYMDTLAFNMTSISAVPEVNTGVMLLVGVAVIGLIRRRAG